MLSAESTVNKGTQALWVSKMNNPRLILESLAVIQYSKKMKDF